MSLIASLKEKLLELKIEPKKALGQNFLINANVIDKIIQTTINLCPENVLEIGPGLGALTEPLIELLKQEKIKSLTLLEWDHFFSQIWKEKGIPVVDGDALIWEGWKELAKPNETLLISNLPYQISSSIVMDRSTDLHRLNAMILMFQKEVAQRIMAKPKTENYGLLSVIAQTFWNVELLLEAGPRDFYPAPQIASRVLVFKSKNVNIEKPIKFLKWVKVGFSHRRKLLRSNLGALNSNPDVLLDRIGVSQKCRAEELSVLQWQNLYNESL